MPYISNRTERILIRPLHQLVFYAIDKIAVIEVSFIYNKYIILALLKSLDQAFLFLTE